MSLFETVDGRRKLEVELLTQHTDIIFAAPGSDDARYLDNNNGAEGLLVSGAKVLVPSRLKNNPLKLLRVLHHEKTEALMQALARYDKTRYRGIKELIQPREDIREAYSALFSEKRPPDLTPEPLLNDMVAKAFELMILIEKKMISSRELTPKERRFIGVIRPIINARRDYFSEVFWDTHAREVTIRTALATGLPLYQAASAMEGQGPRDKGQEESADTAGVRVARTEERSSAVHPVVRPPRKDLGRRMERIYTWERAAMGVGDDREAYLRRIVDLYAKLVAPGSGKYDLGEAVLIENSLLRLLLSGDDHVSEVMTALIEHGHYTEPARKALVKMMEFARTRQSGDPAMPTIKADRDRFLLTADERARFTPSYPGGFEELLRAHGGSWETLIGQLAPEDKLVVFVRHIEAISNIRQTIQSDTSYSPGTAFGDRQRAALARYLGGHHVTFDWYGSSGLERAYVTLSSILPEGRSRAILPILNELSIFPGGYDYAKVMRFYKRIARRFYESPLDFVGPDRSMRDIENGLRELYYDTIPGDKDHRTFGAAAHGRSIEMSLAAMFGISLDKYADLISTMGNLPNVSLTVVKYTAATKTWELLAYADNAFLPQDLQRGTKGAWATGYEKIRASGIAIIRAVRYTLFGQTLEGVTDYLPSLAYFLPFAGTALQRQVDAILALAPLRRDRPDFDDAQPLLADISVTPNRPSAAKIVTAGAVVAGIVVGAFAVEVALRHLAGGFSVWQYYIGLNNRPGLSSLVASGVTALILGTGARIMGMYLSDTRTRRSVPIITAIFLLQLVWRPIVGALTDISFWVIEKNFDLPVLRALTSLACGFAMSAVFDLFEPMFLAGLDARIHERAGDSEKARELRGEVNLRRQWERVKTGIMARIVSSYFQHDLTQNLVSREYRVLVLFTMGFFNNTFRSMVAFTRKPSMAPGKVFAWGAMFATFSGVLIAPLNGLAGLVMAVASAAYFKKDPFVKALKAWWAKQNRLGIVAPGFGFGLSSARPHLAPDKGASEGGSVTDAESQENGPDHAGVLEDARSTDAPAIKKLSDRLYRGDIRRSQQYYARAIAESATNPRSRVLVYRVHGTVAGYAYGRYEREKQVFCIVDVVVRDDMRGRKIGMMLTGGLLRHALEKGEERFGCEAISDEMVSILKKLGFVLKNSIGHSRGRGWYEADLSLLIGFRLSDASDEQSPSVSRKKPMPRSPDHPALADTGMWDARVAVGGVLTALYYHVVWAIGEWWAAQQRIGIVAGAAAGFDGGKGKRLEKDEIVRLLNDPPPDVADPSSSSAWIGAGRRTVVNVAIRIFGSWRAAVAAAGLPPRMPSAARKEAWEERYRDWEAVRRIVPGLIRGSGRVCAKRPDLTQDEACALVREVRRGNGAAHDALIEAYRGLVYKIAKRYYRSTQDLGVSIEELVSAGTHGYGGYLKGLVRAVELYDPDQAHETQFITYAYHAIRNTMRGYLAQVAEERKRALYGEDATGKNGKKSRAARAAAVRRSVNPFKPILEVMSADEIIDALVRAGGVQTERDKNILRLRMEGLTMKAIGEQFGLKGWERVRQIQKKAIEALRAAYRKPQDRDDDTVPRADLGMWDALAMIGGMLVGLYNHVTWALGKWWADQQKLGIVAGGGGFSRKKDPVTRWVRGGAKPDRLLETIEGAAVIPAPEPTTASSLLPYKPLRRYAITDSRPKGVMVIGAGHIGPRHLAAMPNALACLSGEANVSIIGLIDNDPDEQRFASKARTVRHLFETVNRGMEAPPAFHSIDAALDYAREEKGLAPEDVIALVCVPNEYHLPVSAELANRGVRMICVEKPLANTLTDINKIISLRDRKKLRMACVTQFPFSLAFQHVLAYIEEQRQKGIRPVRWETFYSKDRLTGAQAGKNVGDPHIFLYESIHQLAMAAQISPIVRVTNAYAEDAIFGDGGPALPFHAKGALATKHRDIWAVNYTDFSKPGITEKQKIFNVHFDDGSLLAVNFAPDHGYVSHFSYHGPDGTLLDDFIIEETVVDMLVLGDAAWLYALLSGKEEVPYSAFDGTTSATSLAFHRDLMKTIHAGIAVTRASRRDPWWRRAMHALTPRTWWAIPAIPATTIGLSLLAGDQYVQFVTASRKQEFFAKILIAAFARGAGSFIQQVVRGDRIDWREVRRWALAGGVTVGIITYLIWYPLSVKYFTLVEDRVDADLILYTVAVVLPLNFLIEKYFVKRDPSEVSWWDTLKRFVFLFGGNYFYWRTVLRYGWAYMPDKIILVQANAMIVWAPILTYFLRSWSLSQASRRSSGVVSAPAAVDALGDPSSRAAVPLIQKADGGLMRRVLVGLFRTIAVLGYTAISLVYILSGDYVPPTWKPVKETAITPRQKTVTMTYDELVDKKESVRLAVPPTMYVPKQVSSLKVPMTKTDKPYQDESDHALNVDLHGRLRLNDGGMIAVDSDVIKLGTPVRLRLRNGEEATFRAEDIGSAVYGTKLDFSIPKDNESIRAQFKEMFEGAVIETGGRTFGVSFDPEALKLKSMTISVPTVITRSYPAVVTENETTEYTGYEILAPGGTRPRRDTFTFLLPLPLIAYGAYLRWSRQKVVPGAKSNGNLSPGSETQAAPATDVSSVDARRKVVGSLPREEYLHDKRASRGMLFMGIRPGEDDELGGFSYLRERGYVYGPADERNGIRSNLGFADEANIAGHFGTEDAAIVVISADRFNAMIDRAVAGIEKVEVVEFNYPFIIETIPLEDVDSVLITASTAKRHADLFGVAPTGAYDALLRSKTIVIDPDDEDVTRASYDAFHNPFTYALRRYLKEKAIAAARYDRVMTIEVVGESDVDAILHLWRTVFLPSLKSYRYRQDDPDWITKIEEKSKDELIRALLNTGEHRSVAFVAKNRGKTIGFSMAHIDRQNREGWIDAVAVSYRANREGVGTRLFSEARTWLAAQPGVDTLFVLDESAFSSARRIAGRAGFKHTARQGVLALSLERGMRTSPAGSPAECLMTILREGLSGRTDISIKNDVAPKRFKRGGVSLHASSTVYKEVAILKALGILVKGTKPRTYQLRRELMDLPPPELAATISRICDIEIDGVKWLRRGTIPGDKRFAIMFALAKEAERLFTGPVSAAEAMDRHRAEIDDFVATRAFADRHGQEEAADLSGIVPDRLWRTGSGLVYAGESIAFEREFARWAGLIDGTEPGETWRYTATQAAHATTGPRSRFLGSAMIAVRHLAENVDWHADGLGVLMAGYDDATGEGYVAVRDAGAEGFPCDENGRLDIELVQGGFLKQKSMVYRGDGIGFGRIVKEGDVTIVSHGQVARIKNGEIQPGRVPVAPYTGPAADMRAVQTGSLVVVRFGSGAPGTSEDDRSGAPVTPPEDVARRFKYLFERADGGVVSFSADCTMEEMFGFPRTELTGKDLLVLGCGAGIACFSAHLAGARRTVGVDKDANSVATARMLSAHIRDPLMHDGLRKPLPRLDGANLREAIAMVADSTRRDAFDGTSVLPEGLEFIETSATDLSVLADSSFDAAAMPYLLAVENGIRNAQDMQDALREAIRVLRPGGTLFITPYYSPEVWADISSRYRYTEPSAAGEYFAMAGLLLMLNELERNGYGHKKLVPVPHKTGLFRVVADTDASGGVSVQCMMSPANQLKRWLERRDLFAMVRKPLHPCEIRYVEGGRRIGFMTKNKKSDETAISLCSVLGAAQALVFENIGLLKMDMQEKVMEDLRAFLSRPNKVPPEIGVVRDCAATSLRATTTDVSVPDLVLFDEAWVKVFLRYADDQKFGAVVRWLLSERLFHEFAHAPTEAEQMLRDICYYSFILSGKAVVRYAGKDVTITEDDINAFFDLKDVKSSQIARKTSARFKFIRGQAVKMLAGGKDAIDMDAVREYVGIYDEPITFLDPRLTDWQFQFMVPPDDQVAPDVNAGRAAQALWWDDAALLGTFIAFISATEHSDEEKRALADAVALHEGIPVGLVQGESLGSHDDLPGGRDIILHFEIAGLHDGRVMYQFPDDPGFRLVKHYGPDGELDSLIHFKGQELRRFLFISRDSADETHYEAGLERFRGRTMYSNVYVISEDDFIDEYVEPSRRDAVRERGLSDDEREELARLNLALFILQEFRPEFMKHAEYPFACGLSQLICTRALQNAGLATATPYRRELHELRDVQNYTAVVVAGVELIIDMNADCWETSPEAEGQGVMEMRDVGVVCLPRWRVKEDPTRFIFYHEMGLEEMLRGARLMSPVTLPGGVIVMPEQTNGRVVAEETIDEKYTERLSEASGVVAGYQEKSQSLILYADDIVHTAAMVDLENAVKKILGEHKMLEGGKIILFAKEKGNALAVEHLIKQAGGAIEVITVTQDELVDPKSQAGASDAKVTEELLRFARRKGAKDVLAIIRGSTDAPEELAALSKTKQVPIVLVGVERAFYSFAEAIAAAIRIKQSQGEDGWLIILPPVRTITAELEVMYERHLQSLVALVAA